MHLRDQHSNFAALAALFMAYYRQIWKTAFSSLFYGCAAGFRYMQQQLTFAYEFPADSPVWDIHHDQRQVFPGGLSLLTDTVSNFFYMFLVTWLNNCGCCCPRLPLSYQKKQDSLPCNSCTSTSICRVNLQAVALQLVVLVET